jgi:putative RecB family exonuclease
MTRKERYSHSRLESFKQCALKYKFRYIDKIKVEKKSIEGFLGSKVHDTLEWLYYEVRKGKVPSIDDMIINYASSWEEEFNPEIYFVVKKQFTIKDYFEKGVKFLLDYYQKNAPFDENTLALEKFVTILLDEDESYKMIGVIDRLVYNKEKEEYEVHDYKTANTLPTPDKVETDRQLPLYSIAIKDNYNADKIQLIWHYLAHNKRIYSRRTDEQLDLLKKETIELINKIEDTTLFPYNQSILCGWCEYQDICPTRRKQRRLDV